jgi:hypothetical protein
MKRNLSLMAADHICGALIAGLLCASAAIAEDAGDLADADLTEVGQCDALPPKASIMVFSWRDTTVVCREMIRVLEGVTISDVRSFEKAAAVLHFKGYEKEKLQIVKELVDIVRLRGFFNKRDDLIFNRSDLDHVATFCDFEWRGNGRDNWRGTSRECQYGHSGVFQHDRVPFFVGSLL